ncbi:NAD(P)-dependent oxidoreductase [Boseongicola aestuarii]|uniref:2-(Hydroxymethyl)glutarate dehydrogenase n=1 Tax=Boseongicola aestuarii TaxID=1470561 RepID=A0A238IXY0_9RHOB|nr:NAD(P)-dependent oxidoreductase [Boseongicola aestuarii]SMX22903.1 2-(hydroxymethyl)glutarate dehydrogenase [Boseongicola aestuarii]
MNERIGVIGLGRMGWALAARFASQGALVQGWTRSGVDSEQAAAAGFEGVGEMRDLVAASDVLVLSLFNDDAARDVLTQLSTLDLTSKLIVETSTVSPTVVRDLLASIERAGGALLDAPISGGPDMVEAGTVGMFVGGKDADVARFLPVAALASDKVAHVGPLGAGASAKIVNNMVLTGMWEVLSEALETGAGLGLGMDTMLGFLEKSPAASPAFLQRMPIIKGESDAVGFSVSGIAKDAALMVATSQELDREAIALKAALARYETMIGADLGGQDLSTVLPHSVNAVMNK